ncbi:nuclear envelope pore membrane protein POM 121-like isoform X2 [Erythrolamprus reginae]|uniref:nuclear envelope pore membrane protein POM 121-like isoform X2 n=1 Tax=Erythrolamprus reginae TaxID=121349 RepID=UPI00396CA19E
MSRGGSAPGWSWWPPSRRRGRPQQRVRRRLGVGPGLVEGKWAFPAAVLAATGLAAASLSLLVLVLGLSGAALSLIVGAAAGAAGSWIASSGLSGGGKDLRGAPMLTHRFSFASKSGSDAVLANGGPSMSYSSPALLAPERRRGHLCGDHPSSSSRFTMLPARRYPIQQAEYATLGTLPTICWDEYNRKIKPTFRPSNIANSPVTVKIARPDNRIGRSPLLEQLVSPAAFSPASNTTLDPCAKETVLNALKERRKRAVEEGVEDQTFPNDPENKKRRHDSTGSGRSSTEPMVANGAPASPVPKPGSLKRGPLPSHCLEDSSSKRSRTSSLSSANSLPVCGKIGSASSRNCIASSYSSTKGLVSELLRRTGPSATPLSSPASSRSQTPEKPNKKARPPSSNITEEEPQKSKQMPVTADKATPEKKISESPLNQGNTVSSPSSSGSSGPRRRRIQLYTPPSGEFSLPPPIQLGYRITEEDWNAEKRERRRKLYEALADISDSTPSPSVETTSSSQTLTFPLISTNATNGALPISTTASSPLLESLNDMQGQRSPPAQAAMTAPGSTGSPQPPAFSASLDLSSSVTSPRPLALNMPASLSAASPTSGAFLPASSTGSLVTASSDLDHTPAEPSSAPKPSTLFGILTSPPADNPPAATTLSSFAPSTTPIFKPVFGNSAKSDNFSFSTSGTTVVSATVPPVPSLAPPVAPSSIFKPIFGSLSTPVATVLPTTTSSSLFTFSQASHSAASSSDLPAINASNSLGLPVLPDATVTTSVPPVGTASVTFVSMNRPLFSFGPGIPSSATAPSNSSNSTSATVVPTLASQPLLFGAAPNATTAAVPLFQFSQQAAPTGAAVNLLASSSTTNSAPTITAATAVTTPGNTGFSIFNGSGSTSTQPSSAPSATTQVPLPFGSSSSAFSSTFGAASKPPPPYPAVTSQLAFDSGGSESQQAALNPPAAGPLNFGTPFSFNGSVVQPAFGSSAQAPFGGAAPLASFGAPSTSQPAFGVASSILPFGTATTSSTQTTSNSTGSSVFGGAASAPFAFGPSNPPGVAGSAFGVGAGATGAGVPTVGFGFGSGQSGAAEGATPFGTSLAQNSLGAQNQNSAFAFSIPSTPEGNPPFGGTPTPAFGQSTPTPGGGNLSFGTPITPTFGGGTPAAFGLATGTFSIGAGSKTGTRQRLQARRQHTRKK